MLPDSMDSKRKRCPNMVYSFVRSKKSEGSTVFLESQFRNYFTMAVQKKGVTGENLLRILESRLDNVVYRLGLATSRPEARQLVRHGHFTVNGQKANIPSILLSPGDVVAVKDKFRASSKVKAIVDIAGGKVVPKWLEFDAENLTGKIVALPAREEIDLPVKEHLIVERYSRL